MHNKKKMKNQTDWLKFHRAAWLLQRRLQSSSAMQQTSRRRRPVFLLPPTYIEIFDPPFAVIWLTNLQTAAGRQPDYLQVSP